MVKRNDWGTDWDDAPDYIRSRRAKSRAYRSSNFRVYAITALIGGVVIIYGLISEFRLTNNPLSTGAQTAAEPMANPPPAMLDRPVPIQIPQELEPIKPSRTSLEPDTLDQCMGSDKLIDENVVRCRYGELPRSAPQAAKPQGMVSDEYLAQYRSERQDTARQARRNTSHRETESRTIHANGHSTVAIWGSWTIVSIMAVFVEIILAAPLNTANAVRLRKHGSSWSVGAGRLGRRVVGNFLVSE